MRVGGGGDPYVDFGGRPVLISSFQLGYTLRGTVNETRSGLGGQWPAGHGAGQFPQETPINRQLIKPYHAWFGWLCMGHDVLASLTTAS